MKIKKNIAVSDSGFMFNPSTGESYSVNPIGIRIFDLLKQGNSIAKTGEILLNEYDVPEATCEKDLQDFIGLLKYYQLVEEETKTN